jgi:hypothetical protein
MQMVRFLVQLTSEGNEDDAYIWLVKYWVNTIRCWKEGAHNREVSGSESPSEMKIDVSLLE